MKHWMWMLGLCAALQSALAANTAREVNFKELLVAPESYKNDQVVYSEVYRNFSTTFFPYMDKSGFGPTKHILLSVGDPRLPVIAKKTDEITKMVAALKSGSLVRIAGKVRKFSTEPRDTLLPIFYVELKSLDVLKEPSQASPGDTKPELPFKRQMKQPLP